MEIKVEDAAEGTRSVTTGSRGVTSMLCVGGEGVLEDMYAR